MNDNNYIKTNTDDNKYRATRNLNTEIENPEININSAIGINIKDIEQTNNHNNIPNNEIITNYFNDEIKQNNFDNDVINKTTKEIKLENNQPEENKFITNTYQESNLENNYNNIEKTTKNNYIPTNENDIYQPTLKEKKKHQTFKIPTELKIMMFIAFILLLFVIVIPYIYDFIKEIELSIAR